MLTAVLCLLLAQICGAQTYVVLKDHSTTNPKALLGEGDEHWNEVIPILKQKTTPRWFIIEQESYGEPPLVCVEKCLRNFERLWTETPQK